MSMRNFEDRLKDNLRHKFTILSNQAYAGKARLMINQVHWFSLVRLFGLTDDLNKIVKKPISFFSNNDYTTDAELYLKVHPRHIDELERIAKACKMDCKLLMGGMFIECTFTKISLRDFIAHK